MCQLLGMNANTLADEDLSVDLAEHTTPSDRVAWWPPGR
jgi:hypothetical protein